MKIYLYVLIPSAAAFAPLRRSPAQRLRNRLRRAWDGVRWRLTGDLTTFHYSTYDDVANSNIGDIAVAQAVRQLLRQSARTPLDIEEIGWGTLDDARIAEINRDGALFVIGGSGYYFFDAEWGVAPRVIADAVLLSKLRIPVVALSPGVNRLTAGGEAATPPVMPPPTERAMHRLVRSLALSSVRDGFSKTILDAVAPKPSRVIADPALFLEPDAPPAPRPADGVLEVGLNLAVHGNYTNRMLPTTLPLLLALIRELSARRPCRFTYFSHYDGEKMVPALLRRHGVPVREVYDGPRKMLREYVRLDLHICQMMHSAILAVNAGVPTVNLGYDAKNQAFFDLMELPRQCIGVQDATEQRLIELAERTLAEAPLLRQRIARRKAELRSDCDVYLGQMLALAHGSDPFAATVPDLAGRRGR